MLHRIATGTWLPAWVPESTATLSSLLVICSVVQSSTLGYDGSMLNGLNILPTYTEYFDLDATTTGLNTASLFIGGVFGPLCSSFIADKCGRRPAIFLGSSITLVGVFLQVAAQNIAMFVAARILLGFGSAMSGIAAGVYLSETFASRYRAWGVGLLNDFYYVGALIAAGTTLGTGRWQSTWAWRAPSAFQGVFSLSCILILPFVPESPRWLVYKGHSEVARRVVALANSNGDQTSPVVLAVFSEIVDTLTWESTEGRKITFTQIFKDKISRRRLLIAISAGPFACMAGNVISSYYLGPQLDTAGVTSTDDQLKANVVLNVWCLFCALLGTHLIAKWGRKSTALTAECLLVTCLFLIGGLTKLYADDPEGTPRSRIYGSVAVMFLFQGFYSVAWTPLIYVYPSEVLNYSIRAHGLALSQLALYSVALVLVFLMPIGLENIGWRMYIVNASWDIVVVVLIAIFWVETKGKTLEEIDAIFEGQKHSLVPDVELVRTGRVTFDPALGGTKNEPFRETANAERG